LRRPSGVAVFLFGSLPPSGQAGFEKQHDTPPTKSFRPIATRAISTRVRRRTIWTSATSSPFANVDVNQALKVNDQFSFFMNVLNMFDARAPVASAAFQARRTSARPGIIRA
jgi:hypothetical protein